MFEWFKCIIYIEQIKWNVVTRNILMLHAGKKKCQKVFTKSTKSFFFSNSESKQKMGIVQLPTSEKWDKSLCSNPLRVQVSITFDTAGIPEVPHCHCLSLPTKGKTKIPQVSWTSYTRDTFQFRERQKWPTWGNWNTSVRTSKAQQLDFGKSSIESL